MSIEVNKIKMDWIEGETVDQLLKRMNYIFPLVVTKINGKVVPKARYPETSIPDDSVIEVIHLISGG